MRGSTTRDGVWRGVPHDQESFASADIGTASSSSKPVLANL